MAPRLMQLMTDQTEGAQHVRWGRHLYHIKDRQVLALSPVQLKSNAPKSRPNMSCGRIDVQTLRSCEAAAA